jgi:hypothetical protein
MERHNPGKKTERKRIVTSFPKIIGVSLIFSVIIIVILGFHFGYGTYYNILCEKMNVWHNPTYTEIVNFIIDDPTNKMIVLGTNTCDIVTKNLIENARNAGYRAGYVYLDGGNISHAIACFETTDRGLFFVEPQADIILSKAELQNMVERGLYSIKSDRGHIECALQSYTINWYKTTAVPPIQFWSN